jgi:anti-sigma B factor antagonist
MPTITMHEARCAHHLTRGAERVRSDPPRAADVRYDRVERSTDSFSVRLLAIDAGDQEAAVLTVHGEIDLGTAPLLREALLAALEHGSGPVVTDLSEVPFMDSTGVHVLVDTHQQLKPQNRRLAIACREHGQIHKLLALVGLLDTLTVHRSRESAVTGGDERIRSEAASIGPPFGVPSAEENQPGDRIAAQPS